MPTNTRKKIVIYGGSFSGVAAAAKAAYTSKIIKDMPYTLDSLDNYTAEITLIVPDVSGMLGGLGTAGGQNHWDVRHADILNHRAAAPYHKGTFRWIFDKLGQHYNVEEMSSELVTALEKYINITIMYSTDVKDVVMSLDNDTINSITVQKIKRANNGYIVWDSDADEETLTADVYIDASDDGRLTWMSDFQGTVGRFDWPSGKLKSVERNTGVGYQQAASLMFKVKNVCPVTTTDGNHNDHIPNCKGIRKEIVIDGGNYVVVGGLTDNGVCIRNDGESIYKKSESAIHMYNENHKNSTGPIFAIKPMNSAQNGPLYELNTNGEVIQTLKDPLEMEWWVNALLIFNVDGRAYARDCGTKYYPRDMLPGALNVDEAWVMARNELMSSDFITALRSFPGYSQAELVLDDHQKPVVGEVLYIRETIHNVIDTTNSCVGTEGFNYHVTPLEALMGDDTPGADNMSTRIGLGYYQCDINAYERSDLESNGEYIWHNQVSDKLRPDCHIELAEGRAPTDPVYLPFGILCSPNVSNLLTSGMACSCSSVAWAELRVLPNLSVLGDAAGITAGYIANENITLSQIGSSEISAIQALLLGMNPPAKLDKQL